MARPRPWTHVETELLPDRRVLRVGRSLAALRFPDLHEEGAP